MPLARNRQADLQAMDRIGQTKQVYVYRSVTEGSVEERMLERVAQSHEWISLSPVTQQGRAQQIKGYSCRLTLASAAANKDELLEMIIHGGEKIINSSEEYVLFLRRSIRL